MLHPRGVSSEVQPRGRAGVGSWLCASTEHTRRSRCEVDRSTHGNTRFIGGHHHQCSTFTGMILVFGVLLIFFEWYW